MTVNYHHIWQLKTYSRKYSVESYLRYYRLHVYTSEGTWWFFWLDFWHFQICIHAKENSFHLMWYKWQPTPITKQTTLIIMNNKLSQLITSPTQITPTLATLITNIPKLGIHADVIPSTTADHNLVIATVDMAKRSPA